MNNGLEGKISFLVQPAVLVANDDIVGPLRGGLEEKTQAGSLLGEIEFEFRDVGVGGLQGREERDACGGDGSVLVAGAVSTRRTSRGEGVRVASLGRLGEVVVSSKRVRRVTR
jgi:hypothetical protein